MVSVSGAFLCFVLIASLQNAQAISEEKKHEMREKMEPIFMECAKDNNVDLEEMKKNKGVSGSEENDGCFFACVFKKNGVMDDKGMFPTENMVQKVSTISENPEEEKKMISAVKECSSVNEEPVSDGDKGCERASKMMKCLKKQAETLGFKLSH